MEFRVAQQAIVGVAQGSITLVSAVILLMRLHWSLLLLILLCVIPSMFVENRYGYKSYWMMRERAPELRKQHYYGMLLTSDWFIKEIRIFGLEKYFLNLYRELFAKFFCENRQLLIRRSGASLLSMAGSVLGTLLSTGYIILRAVEHSITIGDFALYTQAVSMTHAQLQLLTRNLSALYSNSLFMRNLFEFLSLPARDLSVGRLWTEAIEEIEFRNVSFRYPGVDKYVLQDLCLRVSRGESLALVGKNGAGKTTLAKLLCRVYEPTSGVILINGKDISEYPSFLTGANCDTFPGLWSLLSSC